MMKRLLCFFFLFVLVTPLVLAGAGVKGPSPGERFFDFQPGMEINLGFSLYGSDQLDLVVNGRLTEYTTVTDPDPKGGPRDVLVNVQLPDELPPGLHKVYVGAVEYAPGGMIGGRAGALMSIKVKVLHPEPYIVASLNIEPAGEGSLTASGTLNIDSWSQLPMTVSADITMRNDLGEILHSLQMPAQSLGSNQKLAHPFVLPVQDLRRGFYPVQAIVEYGAPNTTDVNASLRVGAKNIFLRQYTEEITQGMINRFEFDLESDWNQKLEDVYGSVSVGSATSDRTPETSLGPFARERLVAYLDATDLELGTQQGVIRTHFEDEFKEFPIEVEVIAEATEASEVTPAEIQQAKGLLGFDSLTLLYACLVILVIVNLFLLLKQKHKPKEEKHDKPHDKPQPAAAKEKPAQHDAKKHDEQSADSKEYGEWDKPQGP